MKDAEEVLNDMLSIKFKRFPESSNADIQADDERSVSSISSQGS